jgi:hypothetical protein
MMARLITGRDRLVTWGLLSGVSFTGVALPLCDLDGDSLCRDEIPTATGVQMNPVVRCGVDGLRRIGAPWPSIHSRPCAKARLCSQMG